MNRKPYGIMSMICSAYDGLSTSTSKIRLYGISYDKYRMDIKIAVIATFHC